MAGATAGTAAGTGLAVRRRVDYTPLVWLVNSAILAVLVVAPLAILVYTAFQSSGGFTFRNFVEARSEERRVGKECRL